MPASGGPTISVLTPRRRKKESRGSFEYLQKTSPREETSPTLISETKGIGWDDAQTN